MGGWDGALMQRISYAQCLGRQSTKEDWRSFKGILVPYKYWLCFSLFPNTPTPIILRRQGSGEGHP